MTKLSTDHYFKAGCRLARTGSYARSRAITWSKTAPDAAAAREIMRGFDAETALARKAGGVSRTGKPLGK